MGDDKLKLNELDDDEAAEVSKELAYGQEGTHHLRERGVAAHEKLDEGDLAEADEEELGGRSPE